jgi:hypothetical protein
MPRARCIIYYQDITVQAFSGTTYYVSNSSGSDSNNGLSQSTPKKSFAAGMALAGTNTRILFKAGDQWTVTSGISLPANGPGIVGAYGTGARPRITTTGNTDLIDMSVHSDWRLVDLDLVGSLSAAASSYTSAVCGCGHQRTALTCGLSQFNFGFVSDTPVSNLAVIECDVLNNLSYGIFLAGGSNGTVNRAAVMGCWFDQVTREHLLRCYLYKALVSHNVFQRGSGGKHQLKFCGQRPEFAPNEVRYGIIADNRFTNPGAVGWMVSLGPENSDSLETARDIVVERNKWDLGGSTTGIVALQSRGADNIAVRNNLFMGVAYGVVLSHPVPGFNTWNNWKVYNNTFYRPQNPDNDDSFFLDLGQPGGEACIANGWRVYNNVVCMPNAAGWARGIVAATISPAQIACDNNDWYLPRQSALHDVGGASYSFAQWQATGRDANGISGNPLLVDPQNGNASLQAASPARDRGLLLSHVRTDFNCVPRPLGSATDMGAFEYQP